MVSIDIFLATTIKNSDIMGYLSAFWSFYPQEGMVSVKVCSDGRVVDSLMVEASSADEESVRDAVIGSGYIVNDLTNV